MDQINIDEIVEKFKERLLATKEAEKFRNEVIEPLVNKVFEEDFIKVFEEVAETINNKVGTDIIKHYSEGDNKYYIEGSYHKIYFQKSNIDIIENVAYVNIIPIYIWKGVTKHLGPISFVVNINTKQIKWDLPLDNIGTYAKKLFSGFVEDKDFNI